MGLEAQNIQLWGKNGKKLNVNVSWHYQQPKCIFFKKAQKSIKSSCVENNAKRIVKERMVEQKKIVIKPSSTEHELPRNTLQRLQDWGMTVTYC